MNFKTLIILLLLCIILSGFSIGQEKSNEFTVLKGSYLGQKPPGMQPEIFAPGIISLPEFHDFKGSFSPDGKEYYFCRHKLPEIQPTLYYTKMINGVWTKPAHLKIAKGNRTFHPCITHDNQWLLFYWKFEKGQSQKSGYYASFRIDDGWSIPKYAGKGKVVTADKSGFLYANEIVPGNPPNFYMNKISFNNGCFEKYERINIRKHYGNQTHPCIAPDSSYIIFDTQDENSNFFVCFKDKEGCWGEAINLTRHGLIPGARGATISWDGKYLFFGFKGDIWWIDIKVVENLRPEKLSEKITK